MEDFRTLWPNFKKEFVAQIKQQRDIGFKEAWTGPANRTKFYVEKIFPNVAKNLGLVLTTELFKVDAALAIKQQPTNWEIPIIFIESENNFDTAAEEFYKLCSLSAPLRVLITITDDINNENTIGWLKDWSSYIETYSELWQNRGILGIIIADYRFNFYSMAWDEKGALIEELKPIYSNDSK